MHTQPPSPLRILTFNIRYATSSPFKGEEPWSIRRPRLIAQLVHETRQCPCAIICLQEVLHVQLLDILAGLNGHDRDDAGRGACVKEEQEQEEGEEWKYIGIGRDDGSTRGEYSPILYRPATHTLLSSQSLWLSPTPHTPSKGWDAASIRILTVGIFKDTLSRTALAVLNTHLDDQGSTSRLESAKMIISTASKIQGTQAMVLCGDFNSLPSEEAYLTLTNSAISPFRDTHCLVRGQERYGNRFTFTGFGFEGLPLKRIDHVLVAAPSDYDGDGDSGGGEKRLPWQIQGYGILANKFDDGVFLSDHCAVVVDAVWGGGKLS